MCSTTPPAQLLLPSSSRAPGLARSFVRAAACRTHPVEADDDLLLLVSELVTNSVRYGAAPVRVALDCHEQTLNVSVRDAGSTLPQQRQVSPDAEAGRGLALLDALAQAWGVAPVDDAHGSGKSVWFDLRVR